MPNRGASFTSIETIFGPAEGFVYFIAVDDVSPPRVKIGFTHGRPERRMKAMQTGCPFPMRLIGFRPGTYQQERELHDVLSDDRRGGEWFVLSDYARSVIAGALEDLHG